MTRIQAHILAQLGISWISLEKTWAQSDELFPHTTTDQTATCSVLKIHRHCSKCWSKHCWPNVILLNLGEYGFISPWLPWQLTNYWEKVCPRFGTLMFELAWGKIATQCAKHFFSVLDRHSWSAKFLRMAVSAKSRHPWRVLLLSSLVMMFDSQVLAQGKWPFFSCNTQKLKVWLYSQTLPTLKGYLIQATRRVRCFLIR